MSFALAAIIGFVSGIALESLVRLSVPVLAFGLLIVGILFLAWFVVGRRGYLLGALVLLGVALGAFRVWCTPVALPVPFRGELNQSVALVGTVVADPDIRETSERLTIEVVKNGVHTKILAVADRNLPVAYGDQVSVKGKLTEPESFATDGGRTFDYRMFLAKDGVMALVPNARIEVHAPAHGIGTRLLAMLFGAKHAFARALEAALPEPHASLAEGLITGGKQGLGKELLAVFTIVGLLPIVVLSGYNVMIVAESVLAGLSFLPQRFALGIAAVSVGMFVLAAGTGASALRAGLMAGLALFARATHRTYDALRALGVVFLGMLLLNPLLLVFDPGFQFSFVATLGLVVLSSPLAAHLSRVQPTWLRETLATTVAAQLFVLPLLLYETGNLSLVAVPANLLVLPVIPLAMALSAVAGFVSLIVPALAPYAGLPAYAVLSYVINTAEFMARTPFAQIIIPAFPFAVVIALYVLLAWRTVQIRKTAPEAPHSRVR